MTSKGVLVGVLEMSVVVIGADRSGVELEVREEARLRVPKWFGEAVLLGRHWLDSGLVGYLEEEVCVVRGRMGQYEVADFVLLLNAYAISGERTLGGAKNGDAKGAGRCWLGETAPRIAFADKRQMFYSYVLTEAGHFPVELTETSTSIYR